MWQWIAQNGFDLVQTTGVVGGLFYAGRSFKLDRRTRQTEVHISLAEAHRDIWENWPSLATTFRVFQQAVRLR